MLRLNTGLKQFVEFTTINLESRLDEGHQQVPMYNGKTIELHFLRETLDQRRAVRRVNPDHFAVT